MTADLPDHELRAMLVGAAMVLVGLAVAFLSLRSLQGAWAR